MLKLLSICLVVMVYNCPILEAAPSDGDEYHQPSMMAPMSRSGYAQALHDYLAEQQQKREWQALNIPDYAQDYSETEYEGRPKRWGYGNKYRDNKSYGFWITALNKAGNYKRGKRGAPFVHGMSAMQETKNPFTGSYDYSDISELVPDKKPETKQ